MTDPESLLGKRIHQFRIDRYLARGSMGLVFQAFDTVLSRPVALKILFDEDVPGAEGGGSRGRKPPSASFRKPRPRGG